MYFVTDSGTISKIVAGSDPLQAGMRKSEQLYNGASGQQGLEYYLITQATRTEAIKIDFKAYCLQFM